MAESMTPLLAVKGIVLVVCMFFGFFGVFFSIWKQNYFASPGFLFLEISCVLLLHLTNANLKGQLSERYNHSKLTALLFVGIVVAVLTGLNSLYCLAYGIKTEQGFQVEDNGFFFALIPNVLACFWSTILAFDARRCRMVVGGLPTTTYMSPMH